MSDVIDIIHRISYDVDSKQLEKASAEVGNNLKKVEELQVANKKLATEIEKTSKFDTQSRTKLQLAYRANQVQVESLTRAIDAQVGALTAQATATTAGTTATAANTAATAANTAAATSSTTAVAANTAAVTTTAVAENAATVATSRFNGALLGVYATLAPMLLTFVGAAAAVLALQGATYLLGKAVEYITGANTEAAKHQKRLTESLEGANREYEKAYTNVQQLRSSIQSAKDGFIDKERVVKEYNDTIGKTTGQVKSLDEAEQALVKNADAYIQFTLLKAAATQAQEAASKKLFEAEMTRRKRLSDFSTTGDALILPSQGVTAPGFVPGQQDAQRLAAQARIQRSKDRKAEQIKEEDDARKDFEEIAKKFNRDADEISKKYGFGKYGPDPKGDQAPDNVFIQRLQSLKARLAAITAATFKSDDTIRAKITEAIQKDQVEIDKAFQDKKLTGPQRDILTSLLGQIKQSEIDKALGDFNKDRMAAQKKIDDELNNLIQQDAKLRADLIPEDFDRQNALLDLEYQKQADALQRAKEKLLKENADKANSGIIDEDTALKNIQIIEGAYAKLFVDLGLLIKKKKADLSLSLFDDAAKFDKTFFSGKNAELSEQATQQITKLSDSYVRGDINYKTYQKKLTKTLLEETNKRKKIVELPALERDLDLAEKKLAKIKESGSSTEITTAQTKVNEIRTQIANASRSIATTDADTTKKTRDEFLESMRKKITALNDFASAGLQAYQTITQAQEDQVSKDIELQQYRVSRAQAIADRGNAKALQAEEDRLNELQKAREKFARTQMAINAAQTLSQSVLAIASAAGETGAGAIVIVPAVIAALAAGFAAVKALSNDASGFREGVVGLKGPGTSKSDSIPANLSRGESVVTAAGTTPHRDILEGMNAGRQYRLIDHNRLLEMAPGTSTPILQNVPLSGAFVVNNNGGMDTRSMEKRLAAIEKAIEAIPATSLTLDEHGLTANLQTLIHRQNLRSKL